MDKGIEAMKKETESVLARKARAGAMHAGALRGMFVCVMLAVALLAALLMEAEDPHGRGDAQAIVVTACLVIVAALAIAAGACMVLMSLASDESEKLQAEMAGLERRMARRVAGEPEANQRGAAPVLRMPHHFRNDALPYLRPPTDVTP